MILDEIIANKKNELAETKRRMPVSEVKAKAFDKEPARGFGKALSKGGIRLIAEVKKASPSKGVIREDFDPVGIATIYEESGSSCISVLTERKFFQGKLEYLGQIRKAVGLPLLRKDFIIDEYQIYESRVHGADAILLIASLLGKAQAEEYLHLCGELGLSVLFEVHSLDELEKVMRLNTDIIGINNRDLNTLSVDLHTTSSLKREIPPGRIVVSESGITTRDDMQQLDKDGVDAVLIGTSLMKSKDIGKKLDELRGVTEH